MSKGNEKEKSKNMSELKCKNCTFWNETGECTRFPPQIVADGTEPRFPMVLPDMFCAEWMQNDDEMEDDVPFGKLHQELVAASIQVLKAWFGMMDNPEEEKLEPHMEKLKRMLMRSGEW